MCGHHGVRWWRALFTLGWRRVHDGTCSRVARHHSPTDGHHRVAQVEFMGISLMMRVRGRQRAVHHKRAAREALKASTFEGVLRPCPQRVPHRALAICVVVAVVAHPRQLHAVLAHRCADVMPPPLRRIVGSAGHQAPRLATNTWCPDGTPHCPHRALPYRARLGAVVTALRSLQRSTHPHRVSYFARRQRQHGLYWLDRTAHSARGEGLAFPREPSHVRGPHIMCEPHHVVNSAALAHVHVHPAH